MYNVNINLLRYLPCLIFKTSFVLCALYTHFISYIHPCFHIWPLSLSLQHSPLLYSPHLSPPHLSPPHLLSHLLLSSLLLTSPHFYINPLLTLLYFPLLSYKNISSLIISPHLSNPLPAHLSSRLPTNFSSPLLSNLLPPLHPLHSPGGCHYQWHSLRVH